MVIYAIRNCETDKHYIGKTINWEERKKKHLYRLRNNRHRNKHLQSAWNKYGEDAFFFYVIHKCGNIHNLNINEKYWIKETKATDPEWGYNVHLGGETGGFNGKHSKETKRKLAKKKSKKVNQYSLNGNYIQSFPSVKKASKKTGVYKEGIAKAARGKQKTSGGYQWSYTKKERLNKIKSFEERRKKTIRKEGLKKRKKVLQLDKKGNVINEFPSIKNAGEKLKIDPTDICRCCTGEYKQAGNYIWEYKILVYRKQR